MDGCCVFYEYSSDRFLGVKRWAVCYVSPSKLKQRVVGYLADIKRDRSIGFFYTNYSNPVTSDNNKYLILSAGPGPELTKLWKQLDEVAVPVSETQRHIQAVRSDDRLTDLETI